MQTQPDTAPGAPAADEPADPNPYSPFADADPETRHLFPVLLLLGGQPPRPGTLAGTGCGRLAVVPDAPIEVRGPTLPEGVCEGCRQSFALDTPLDPTGKPHPCPCCNAATRHEGNCAACRQQLHKAWNSLQPGPWRQMCTAPEDGTEILGLVYDNPTPMRWAEERHCMLAESYRGTPGIGLFGPGWEDALDSLVICDGVEAWRPIPEDGP
jgi:hypothetical protein